MYAWGYSLAGWIGFGCFFMPASNSHSQFSWRFPLAFQIVFPLILLAGSKLIPFSPRWLLSKGRREEAWQIVKRLHKTPEDINDIKAREEFYLIEKQYEKDKSMQVRSFEIFRTGPNRRRALVGFLLMWGDQYVSWWCKTLARRKVPIPCQIGMPLKRCSDWGSWEILARPFVPSYLPFLLRPLS